MRWLVARVRRLCREDGYTLIELMTVLVILGIVLSGLTIMFQSGVRAELRANRDYQAQQNARLALDMIRNELHCASAVSTSNGPGVASAGMTVTLPTACPGPDTTVTYATQSAGTNRWQLTRAGGAGAAVMIADFLMLDTIFTYHVPAAGTLGRLGVNIPVNLNPADATTEWRLEDDVVLRNTTRL